MLSRGRSLTITRMLGFRAAWRGAVAATGLGLALLASAAPARADGALALDLQATGGVSAEAQIADDEDLGAHHEAPADQGEPVATEAAAGAAAAAEPEPEAAPRDERERVHSSWLGSSGGLHVADAGTGLRGSMRLQLALGFFGGSDYLRSDDEHHSSGGTLSLSYTVLDYLELFGSVAAHSDYNSAGRIKLLQVVGDMLFGAKLGFVPLKWLSVGGELRLFVPSGVGDVGVGFAGTGVGLRGNVSTDLRRVGSGVPLIGRFTLGYYFDQSANLIDDVEDARYGALGDRLPRIDEDRHLITRQERLAFDINRLDQLDLELGVEVPLRVAGDFYLHPLLEWRFGVPVNRQGYDCLSVPTNADENGPDGCLEQEGVAAMPMTMTIGARIFPWLPGFAVSLGVDVGLTGAHTFVRELAPNRPWAFLLAVGYAHEPGRREPVAAPAPEVVSELPPWRGRVEGTVIDAVSQMPIAGAQIEYVGREPTAQVTDEGGLFLSYPFESGEVRMRVSHPDYEPGECLVAMDVTTQPLAAEHRLAVRCELQPRPALGAIEGTVKGPGGAPLSGATIRLTGPRGAVLTSDAEGRFVASELAPGAYELEASAPGFQTSKRSLLVPGSQTLTPELVLMAELPAQSSVRVTKGAVTVKRQVHFRHNSTELETDSFVLLDEVATVLNQNPELVRVEIQGHTDNRGVPAANRALSQARADAVRDYLVKAGVAAERITARGYGDSRPLVPNLTDKNRARNRRVEFIILERAGE
jgi:OOP family OmpA-OmpF porin